MLIELPNIVVFNQWFEFWTPGNGHVQCFGREKTLRIEQIEEIIVDQIGQQLIGQAIQ